MRVRQAEFLQGADDAGNILGVPARTVAHRVDLLIGPQHEAPPAGFTCVLRPPNPASEQDVTPTVDFLAFGKDSAARTIGAEFQDANDLPRHPKLKFAAEPGKPFVGHGTILVSAPA
jgi:hypothetical protein